MTSGGNDFNHFRENQLHKFRAVWSEERCKLPLLCSERSPNRKSNFGICGAKKMHLMAWIMVILVWYKMSTAVSVLCGFPCLLRSDMIFDLHNAYLVYCGRKAQENVFLGLAEEL